MDVYEAIRKRRTIRRFKQDPVSVDVLRKLIDAARIAPSAGNNQPVKYIVCINSKKNQKVFEGLRWAGYIAPAGDPPVGERPTAYILVLLDREIRPSGCERDVGAAVENILLAAMAEGIGSCWLGSIDRAKLRQLFEVKNEYEIDSVLALGYPNEEPEMFEMEDSIKYYKDDQGTLHVPKRRLDDILEIAD